MSLSQERAALILQVRSGQLTATAAARQMGLSRQRYYQWEKRALRAMLQALEDRPKGRPSRSRPDREKLSLKRKVKELEKQLRRFQLKEKLRARLHKLKESLPKSGGSSKKNSR
jgi:hypothetical protein